MHRSEIVITNDSVRFYHYNNGEMIGSSKFHYRIVNEGDLAQISPAKNAWVWIYDQLVSYGENIEFKITLGKE